MISLRTSRTMTETPQRYAEVFDVRAALSSVGGDREYLAELVGLVNAAWPTVLGDIREGMSRGDLRTVEASARLAKSAARNVSAKRAYECALQLETAASRGDLVDAQGAMEKLEREAEMLCFYLGMVGDGSCLD